MNKRKIMKIVFVVLAVILISVLVEVGIRGIVKKVSENSEKKEFEKQQEIIYNSESAKNKRSVSQFVEDIYAAIKDNDYNYVYKFLNPIYCEYMFSGEIDNLKLYLENYEVGTSHSINKISQLGGMYQVMIGVGSGEEYTTKYLTVEKIDENKCLFMFDEYSYIDRKKEKTSTDNVVYELKYSLENQDFMMFVIDVKNISTQSMTVSMKNISFSNNGGKLLKGTLTDDFVLEKNGDTKRINVVFPKVSYGNSSIKFNLLENNEEKELRIFMDR